MVTKIINIYLKMMLTILLGFILVKCAAMNNYSPNSDIFLFENYNKSIIILPDDFNLCDEGIYSIDSIIVNKEKMIQSKKNQITGELYNRLCNINLINQWYAFKKSDLNPYSDKYEVFVEKRKHELDLYFLGKLELSKNFDSYLILVSSVKNDDYNIIKNVFLINVANKKLASITRISSYTCFDGDCNYIYTKVSEKGILMQKVKRVSSDVILPKEVQPEKDKICKKFVYDKKGKLKIY